MAMQLPKTHKPTSDNSEDVPQFKTGDIVQLKSGGIRMTVLEVKCSSLVELIFAPTNQHWPQAEEAIEPLPREQLPMSVLKHVDEPDDFPF